MKFILLVISLLLCSCEFLLNGNQQADEQFGNLNNKQNDERVAQERGKYLVAILGCSDCHTPKIKTDIGMVPDNDRYLSGHTTFYILDIQIDGSDFLISNRQNTIFKGPWGVTYSSNITPDKTGIGYWSFEDFRDAMKEGRYKGKENDRIILPPMPWQNYKNMTNDDIKAIYIYLKSVKPIKNSVPNAIPNYLKNLNQ